MQKLVKTTMAAYCKLMLAVVAILLAQAAKNQCAGENLIQEQVLAKRSAEKEFYNSFADTQNDDYNEDLPEMGQVLLADEQDYESTDEEEAEEKDTEYPDNSELLAEEEDYEADAEEEDYEADAEEDDYEADAEEEDYEAEQHYEMAVEQTIPGVKILKNALEYGIDELHNLASNLVCSRVKGKLSTLQGQNKGTVSTSGSLTEFTAAKNQKVPLSTFIRVNGPFSLYMLHVSYDCSSYDINITVASDVKLNIIPNFMVISGLTASVAVQVTSPTTTLQLEMKGDWSIGSLVIAITATYDINTGTTHVNAHPRSGTSLTSFVKSITGISLPVSPSTKVSFQFNGEMSSSGATTLTMVSDKGVAKFYAVYQSLKASSPSAKAIAVEVPKIKLSSVVKKLIGVDISSIPFFGSFSVPHMGLTYSTEAISNLGSTFFQNSQLLTRFNGAIHKGFSAYIDVPFHNEPLLVLYNQKMLVITTPQKNLKLSKLLQYLVSGGGSWKVSLPSQLSHIFNLNIEGVTIKSGITTVTVSLPKPVVFFTGILSVSKVKASIVIAKKAPKVSAEITGDIHLADATFVTKLAQNSNQKYVLTAIGDRLTINTLFQRLSAAFLPTALTTFLRNIPFLKFAIKKPSLSYTFGVKPMQMHIGGTPVVQGYTVIHMDTLVVRIDSRVKVILGFQLGTTNFAKILKQITGFNFARFPLLSQSISASVTISPLATRTVKFSSSLGSLPIERGVTLRASMKFPKNCGSDIFCKFAGTLIGHNTVLSLQATISSATYFPLSASINNLRLGAGIVLGKAGLEIVGGASPRIGLVGEVILKNPPLIFSARISAGTKGLTCELSVTNCWNKPFGVEWLDICNLLGSIDFAPPTGITGISYGAEIHLGYKSTGHQIQAKGYVGVTIISPAENYYYVKFNSITLGSLLKAFKISLNIPKPLAQSGFPHGFLSSFSLLGKELPQVHVSIPAGFRLKGTLNILGLQGSADITINLPSLIDVNVALPPIKVGSILAMYASASDTSRGPYLKARIQTLPSISVNIEASGYLKVLGISLETKLVVTNTKYIFSFRGRILSLFYASLRIEASYASFSHASFQVNGVFEADLVNGIQNLVKSAINVIGKAAKKAYDAAYGAAKKLVDQYLSAQRAAQNQLNKIQNEVNDLYRKLFIAKVMQSCPNHSCRKAVIQGWSRAVKSVTRTVSRGVKAVGKGINSGINYAKKKLQEAYNKAKSALNSAKNALTSVTNKLNDAKNKLSQVGSKFKEGLKIFNFIRSRGLGAIISIRKITFSVSLGVASTGHFACGVEVQFLGGSTKRFGVSVNLRSLKSVATYFINKVKSAFTSFG